MSLWLRRKGWWEFGWCSPLSWGLDWIQSTREQELSPSNSLHCLTAPVATARATLLSMPCLSCQLLCHNNKVSKSIGLHPTSVPYSADSPSSLPWWCLAGCWSIKVSWTTWSLNSDKCQETQQWERMYCQKWPFPQLHFKPISVHICITQHWSQWTQSSACFWFQRLLIKMPSCHQLKRTPASKGSLTVKEQCIWRLTVFAGDLITSTKYLKRSNVSLSIICCEWFIRVIGIIYMLSTAAWVPFPLSKLSAHTSEWEGPCTSRRQAGVELAGVADGPWVVLDLWAKATVVAAWHHSRNACGTVWLSPCMPSSSSSSWRFVCPNGSQAECHNWEKWEICNMWTCESVCYACFPSFSGVSCCVDVEETLDTFEEERRTTE